MWRGAGFLLEGKWVRYTIESGESGEWCDVWQLTVRGAVDVALWVGEGQNLLSCSVLAEVHLEVIWYKVGCRLQWKLCN
jgi:hypothetical protein